MCYSGTGSHPLYITRPDNRAVAHAVFVFKSTIDDIGYDFHVAMGVLSKSLARLNPIFIDDPQCTKPHMPVIIIISKGKGVVCIEPAMVDVSTLRRFSYAYHIGTPSLFFNQLLALCSGNNDNCSRCIFGR